VVFRPVETFPPVIKIREGESLSPEAIPSILREINGRQFNAIREVLLEAKFKAEAMLRDDKIASDHGRLAYYTGWVSYADFVLASMETLRADQSPDDTP